MASFIRSRALRILCPAVLAGTVILPSAALAAQATAPTAVPRSAGPGHWITYSPRTHTVHLALISSYGDPMSYNFDGGSGGKFLVTVPLNSKVVVTYSNQSTMMPHGAEVVAWTGTLPTSGLPPQPAFSGAFSPNYLHGTPAGVTQVFTFTAARAGKYLLICPVHNHVKFGHWAWFVVSKTATKAKAVIQP